MPDKPIITNLKPEPQPERLAKEQPLTGNAMHNMSRFTFAPSELVFLNGEKYARSAGAFTSTVQLLHVNLKVSSIDLSQTALTAALLACEEAGNIYLKQEERKTRFGLRRAKTLVAGMARARVRFPDYSLESFACSIIEAGAIEVSELVYRLLREDAADAAQWAIDLVQGGLAARGILEIEKRTDSNAVASSRFLLTQAKAKLAALQPLAPINDLLNQAARRRPEIYKLLEEQVKKGLAKRQVGSNISDLS